MHKPYYWMAPVGGLIRSTKRELRYLDTGFYGLGFPHWGIEAVAEAYSKFFLHFGTSTLLGMQLRMSVKLFIMELGLSPQPFLDDYHRYGDRAMPGFCSELWSRPHCFNLCLSLHMEQFQLPSEDDQWIMKVFEQKGFSPPECKMLNLVRLHQQVLFESDIFAADGLQIDLKYLFQRDPGTTWSKYRFVKQILPASYFIL
jgi:hypothetical protein